MTANQCEKLNLDAPRFNETFSLCSLREDTQLGDNWWSNAIQRCCTTPIKNFQCWNYCEVDQSMFPSWLGCVSKALNTTWGSACQSADQSPTVTEITIYPATFTTPPSSLIVRTSSNVATNTSTISSSVTGVKNLTNGTPTALASPTYVQASESIRVLDLSVGGMMCAFLVLSTIAL
ncbi:hypothetical protein EG329_006328 [Mollisiaceae sp. DMI_Dod_QoI]|nr:hypothetical protein EG329_006328 [Helotiales sp. DMI_Dod_QoI]